MTHIFRLENVADHPVQPPVVVGHGGVLGGVVQIVLCAAGSDHLPPGHQHHHVTDVCYVGDRPQWQVHYRLLVAKHRHEVLLINPRGNVTMMLLSRLR